MSPGVFMRTSRVPSTGAAELMNFNRLVLGSCFTPAHGRCRGGLHVPELRTRRLAIGRRKRPDAPIREHIRPRSQETDRFDYPASLPAVQTKKAARSSPTMAAPAASFLE